MLQDEFIQKLRCVVNRSPLARVDADLLQRVNRLILAGAVSNQQGQRLSRPLDAGLVNREGTLLYPVYGDTPTLIGREAIRLDQLRLGDQDLAEQPETGI